VYCPGEPQISLVHTGVDVGVGVSVNVEVTVAVIVDVAVDEAVTEDVAVDVAVGVDVGVGVGVGVGNVSLKAKASLRWPFLLVFEYPNPPNRIGSVPLVFQKAGPKRPPGTTLELDSFKTPYTEKASTLWLPLIHAH